MPRAGELTKNENPIVFLGIIEAKKQKMKTPIHYVVTLYRLRLGPRHSINKFSKNFIPFMNPI